VTLAIATYARVVIPSVPPAWTNERGSYMALHVRKDQWKQLAWTLGHSARNEARWPPLERVEPTRRWVKFDLYRRRLLDADNATTSIKPCLDGLKGVLIVDDSARWLGYFDGELQLFECGSVSILHPALASEPMSLDTAVVFFGRNAQKFQTILNEDEDVFVLGLKPRRTYQIEVDDEAMNEAKTDAGGILELKLPHKVQIGVRLHEAPTFGSAPPKPAIGKDAAGQAPGRF